MPFRARNRGLFTAGRGLSGTQTYKQLLIGQGFDHYWSLQTQRNDTASEPDLIGSKTMTMTGGATVNNISGPLSSTDGGGAQTFVTSDTEGFVHSATNIDIGGSFSLSGWWKLGVQTGTANILSAVEMAGDLANSYLYLIRRDDRSGLCLQFGDGAGGGGANFLDFGVEIENDGLWHHIVVTRNKSSVAADDRFTCWLDNVQRAQASRATIGLTGLWEIGGPMSIANRSTVNVGMDGSVAHVALNLGTEIDAAAVAAQWARRSF